MPPLEPRKIRESGSTYQITETTRKIEKFVIITLLRIRHLNLMRVNKAPEPPNNIRIDQMKCFKETPIIFFLNNWLLDNEPFLNLIFICY